MTAEQRWVLNVACPSKSGQVAAISGFLDSHGCYINEFSCFDDDLSERFFVRAVFRPGSDAAAIPSSLRAEFEPVAARFKMEWAMHALSERPKVLIMVSKLDHCLRDLLYRWRIGELKIDIWLARDYANLPVRLKITDKNGEVLDQVATGVDLGARPAAP